MQRELWIAYEQVDSVNLLVVGVSHRTAPVELRERLAIPGRDLPEALARLRTAFEFEEAVILSTCNRVECYVASTQSRDITQAALMDFLASRSRLQPEQFQPHVYRLTGRDAAAHLFRVTAGLDSMLFGESEVTAQVKHAYLTAHATGTTGPLLNRLFQRALHATKLLRSQTRVAEGSASIGSAVVALARQCLGPRFSEAQVLLWGAGKAAEATTKHLVSAGIGQVWIVNRTEAKAKDLATLCQGQCLSWEQAIAHLAHVDIAVVCTQAPHYVIDAGDLETILPQRQGRALCLIDLAVPRNIDPALSAQPGVRLYNVDDLQTLAQGALQQRRQALARCTELIDEQVTQCLRRLTPSAQQEGPLCEPVEVCSSV